MKVVMTMNWEGVTPDQYEAVRKTANWEGNIPTGAIFHVSSFSESGLKVTDIWDSADNFNNFVHERLMPAVALAGIATQPHVEITPAHAIFSPYPDRLV